MRQNRSLRQDIIGRIYQAERSFLKLIPQDQHINSMRNHRPKKDNKVHNHDNYDLYDQFYSFQF